MPQSKLIAIHQPTFFSWLGYYDKIFRADIFVILDSVQFPKTGGFWVNRSKILIAGNEHWLTVPVKRNYSGTRNINEMEINNSTKWQEKNIKTIDINYRNAPHFEEVFPLLSGLLSYQTESICDYDLNITYRMCDQLGLDKSKMIKSSSIDYEGNATDMLISITKLLGGSAYMCGGGASNYQEDEKFEEAGISLVYQNFKHPEYKQFNSKEFVPGLSIIDPLMNLGIDGVKSLIHSRGNN
jgi:hypothetical protein